MLKKLLKKCRINIRVAIGLVIIAVIAAGIYSYYLYSVYFPSTENAYVHAHKIAIAPRVSGHIAKVHVNNNQHVDKGDLLVTIDRRHYRLQKQQARQNLALATQQAEQAREKISAARTDLEKAKADLDFANEMAERYRNLYKQKAGSQQSMQKYANKAAQARQGHKQARIALNQAKVAYEIARTRKRLAKVKLEQARLQLSYTRIHAPASGYIGNLDLHAGQVVKQGEKLFALVDDQQWWINVNFKETQLSRLQPGQPATIELDMYNHTYHGTVQSISPASGSSFSLLPRQNATGNWVKVTQRFTVRVAIENNPDYPLRLGASAHVRVNTLK